MNEPKEPTKETKEPYNKTNIEKKNINSKNTIEEKPIKEININLNKNHETKFQKKQVKEKKFETETTIEEEKSNLSDLDKDSQRDTKIEINAKNKFEEKTIKEENNYFNENLYYRYEDEDSENEVKEVHLSEEAEEIIQALYSKKYWALKELSKKEQIAFIKTLVELGDDKHKQQREKILGTPKPDEYQYFLSEVFNSNFLTYDALIELSSFLYKKEPSTTKLFEEIKSIWKNPFNDLDLRDISGKRDRMKVMISPTFQAKIIAAHIKLAKHFRDNGFLDSNNHQDEFYHHIIRIAESEYSKLSKEFWSSYLLHVVALSFIISLISIAVQAILTLVGSVLFTPFVVLMISTLVSMYSKFHENYKMWPWEWVYWWKDAKEQCLTCLKSEYMKEVLSEGKTEKTLDTGLKGNDTKRENEINPQGQVNENQIKENQINENNNIVSGDNAKDNNIVAEFSKLEKDEEKKSFKANRKLCLSLCKFFAIILILAVLTYFFPSVVAAVISSMLTVFKINLALTISASVVSCSFWAAITAAVGAIVCGITYKINAKRYLQAKFDLYQKDHQPKGDKYFMRFNKENGRYTAEELKERGIEVEVTEVNEPKNEPKSENQLEDNNIEIKGPINSTTNQ